MEPASGTHSAAAAFWTTKVDSRGNFNEAFRRLNGWAAVPRCGGRNRIQAMKP